jgi:hypothetical protein
MLCLPLRQKPPRYDAQETAASNIVSWLEFRALAPATGPCISIALANPTQNPPEAQPKKGSIRLAMAALGCAPTMRSTSRPPLNTRRAGMLRMLKRSAVTGFSSTFNFPTRSLPRFSAASCSMAGAIILHGPHHGAHMSSSTGKGERSTSLEKLASVMVRGSEDAISGVLHRPQTGCRP